MTDPGGTRSFIWELPLFGDSDYFLEGAPHLRWVHPDMSSWEDSSAAVEAGFFDPIQVKGEMSPLFKKSSGKWLHELKRVVQGIFFDLFKHKQASKKYIYIHIYIYVVLLGSLA